MRVERRTLDEMSRSPLALDAVSAVREMRGHALRGLTYEEVRAAWMGATRRRDKTSWLPSWSPDEPPAEAAGLAPPPELGRQGAAGILSPDSLFQPRAPAVCSCWAPAAFDTSCVCGAESVTCEPKDGFCHCSGTCKQGVISEYDGKVEWCVGGDGHPATFAGIVMYACDAVQRPDRGGTPEPRVSGFLVTAPTALARDWSRQAPAGCVYNNHDTLVVLAYDCDASRFSAVTPNSTNCDSTYYTQPDWDFVLVGGRWHKMDGGASSFLFGRPTCTIEDDGSVSGLYCRDTGLDAPARPC
jgi:hypothetical protein